MRLILSLFAACLLLMACNTQKRDIKRLDGLFVQYPSESARLSNQIYPCFGELPTAKPDTLIIHGKIDTIPGLSWTVTNTKYDTVFKTVNQIKYVIKPITKLVRDTVVNYRALADVNDKLKVKSDSLIIDKQILQDVKKGKGIWMWIAICASAVIVIFIVAKVVLLVNGGWAKSVIP